ncbi:MAG: sodium:solute symporter [Phaeodactylibacter xiamenensis]|uniref:Sodium:solute symporter n=1 Tax=Phaeodactylibacter xiamenensis TaxID=1524460 RepID=A0A098S5Z4_9BACT|nr:sodium:solute symporter [Phaeodactylibacter xiamenensis]KGE87218.1 sodium:solute symporter [Phaeodactylibacter xiamenensis]MCR9052263.1 sodium:solute symporter [bacterium]
METLDWIIMLGTLLSIVAYGVWYTRKVDNVQSYLLGDRDLPWWTIGLSVMATQASAITFLSTPGQAYEDGMRFAQFYFGLPVAMVILCVFVLPIYYRLKVYTAYEYLEGRFDLRTRTLTAILFLIQRGLAAGLTIYAPAIILSTILGWSLRWTVLFIGALVIFYTMLGGTKAVSVTQKQQMIVILSGMFIAAMILIFQLPPDVGFSDAVGVAGKMGKLNVVDFEFDLSNRYNFWSGMLGGVFLFLSYFGTDQSQVQRYLSGKSLNESRLGLLFNGILKVPMQFLVLFVGILVFVFFQFNQPPIHFNSANLEKLENTEYADDLASLQAQHNTLFLTQQEEVRALMGAIDQNDEPAISEIQQRLSTLRETDSELRKATKDLILQADPASKIKDTDYVFITFVTEYLPVGLVGLLLAVIFSAAMSSTASELNALATTTVVDLYRRSFAKDKSDRHYLNASKAFTAVWGGIALVFAATANLFENLIQAVNIIGSLFYGAILGIFVVAFFMKKVGGRAVFIGALIAEAIVLIIFTLNSMEIINIAYLWLNLIGCTLVMGFAWILEQAMPEPTAPNA